jgi:predicted DNA-binding transcriptional regulator AlpA
MDLLTIDECAALLKVKPPTVYEMTSQRGRARSPYPLPVLRLNSKCLRFRKQDIEAWLERIAKENE